MIPMTITITTSAEPVAKVYTDLLEKAYVDFLDPLCSFCHNADSPIAAHGLLDLGLSNDAVTLASTEQGLLAMLEQDTGFDKVYANPIDGQNGHGTTLSTEDAQTWTDLMAAFETHLNVSNNNNAPVASMSLPIATGLTVSFDASGSSDPDSDVLTYSWNLNSEAVVSGVNGTYTFAENGLKVIQLTVTDGNGGSSTDTKSIVVTKINEAPVVSFGYY